MVSYHVYIHNSPQRNPILSFWQTFSPESNHVRGRPPPHTHRKILDPQSLWCHSTKFCNIRNFAKLLYDYRGFTIDSWVALLDTRGHVVCWCDIFFRIRLCEQAETSSSQNQNGMKRGWKWIGHFITSLPDPRREEIRYILSLKFITSETFVNTQWTAHTSRNLSTEYVSGIRRWWIRHTKTTFLLHL